MEFLFFFFSTFLIASSSGVILSHNPVHGVLFLILSFFNAASLFLIADAEFLALLLVIVYVGAVAVLFLFIVMMLDINFKQLGGTISRYTPIISLIAAIFLLELTVVSYFASKYYPIAFQNSSLPIENFSGTNIQKLGKNLYTYYFSDFQTAGLVLLVAMIGAIVLTLRSRSGVKHQKISEQVSRTSRESLKIHKVPFRKGVEI